MSRVGDAGSLWRSRQTRNVTTYGSARWANMRDIRKAGLFKDAGLFLGRMGPHYLRPDDRAYHGSRGASRTQVSEEAERGTVPHSKQSQTVHTNRSNKVTPTSRK
jgi:hypothetical protein